MALSTLLADDDIFPGKNTKNLSCIPRQRICLHLETTETVLSRSAGFNPFRSLMAGDVSGSPALRPIPIDVVEKDDKFEIKVGNSIESSFSRFKRITCPSQHCVRLFGQWRLGAELHLQCLGGSSWRGPGRRSSECRWRCPHHCRLDVILHADSISLQMTSRSNGHSEPLVRAYVFRVQHLHQSLWCSVPALHIFCNISWKLWLKSWCCAWPCSCGSELPICC